MITPEKIDEVKKRIVQHFHPEKIILFGSYANGNPTEDSDLDLLIIKKTDLPQGERRKDLRNHLRDLNISIDILVYTPEEVDYWKNASMAFVTRALNEGKIIYGH